MKLMQQETDKSNNIIAVLSDVSHALAVLTKYFCINLRKLISLQLKCSPLTPVKPRGKKYTEI